MWPLVRWLISDVSARARARALHGNSQTQDAARGINKLVHVWFVCQIEVPMGTTDWHKKQGSGVFKFSQGGIYVTVYQRARARARCIT